MIALEPRFVSLLGRLKMSSERLRQRRSSGPGGHLSKGLGQSLDFSEYRPYQPGDDLRALDWKVYGRTDRLYTKLYVPEQEETVLFAIDSSGSMAAKWSFARAAVLGLATIGLGQGDRVSLRFLDREARATVEGLPPLRGKSGLARVSRFLEGAEPGGVCDLDRAFESLARQIKARLHIVIVSDFLKPGGGLKGLSQLRYRKHRLTLLQMLSPAEIDPEKELAPGEWELYDPEPEGETAATDRIGLDLGRQAFSSYRAALAAHNAQLKDFARLAGAAYISVDIATDLTVYFSETLRQGGLLV